MVLLILGTGTENLVEVTVDIDGPTDATTVKEAIHAAKKGLPSNGSRKNPDVIIDTDTDEVYVQQSDGPPSDDSIGNILDHLKPKN